MGRMEEEMEEVIDASVVVVAGVEADFGIAWFFTANI